MQATTSTLATPDEHLAGARNTYTAKAYAARNAGSFDLSCALPEFGDMRVAKEPPQINLNNLRVFYILEMCPTPRDFKIGC